MAAPAAVGAKAKARDRAPNMDELEYMAALASYLEAAERQQQQKTVDIDAYARGRYPDQLQLFNDEVLAFVPRRVGKGKKWWDIEASKMERKAGASFIPGVKRMLSKLRNHYTPLYYPSTSRT